MSSNPSSRILVALVTGLVLAAGAAGAVSVAESSVPDEAAVGEQITVTVTLDQLFRNPSIEEWTLEGETGLTNATWTVTDFDQAGNQLRQESYGGATFEHEVSIENNVAEIEVRVTGTVPEVANWSYDPPQNVTAVELRQVRGGGTTDTIATFGVHHYTEESAAAREAIAAAEAAVDGSGSDEAASTLESAISAYNAGNFPNAERLAEEAESRARKAKQVQQRNRMLLLGGLGVVVLGVIVGGVFWYRSRQTTSKL